MKNKNKYIALINFFIASFLLTFLIITAIRPWTHFPSFEKIVISKEQSKLAGSSHLYDYFGKFSQYAYFTILSNTIAVIVISINWLSFNKIKISKNIKTYILIYMFITAIIFWTSLAPFMPWGQGKFFDYENIHEHAIVFILIFMWWYQDKNKINNSKKTFGYFLAYPIIYIIYATIIYASFPERIAIYPFINYLNFFALDLNVGLSLFLTIISIVLIALLFAGVYLLFIKWDIKRLKKIAN